MFVFEGVAANLLSRVDRPEAQEAIDNLLAADLELATVQIDIAIAAGADPGEIAEAEESVADAMQHAAAGSYVAGDPTTTGGRGSRRSTQRRSRRCVSPRSTPH